MANFPKMTLTNAGIALQTKVQAGSTLAFKRLAMGDGELNGSPVSPLTALIGEKASVTVTSGKIMGADTYQIGGLFVNTSIVAGFWWREIGVYATDPTDSEKEILYCYANAGDAGDYIPPSADQRIEKHIYASMAVANASSVTITIPSSDSYVLASEKGAADGVATLGTDGKVPSEQMPTMNYEAPLSGASAKATIVDADKVVITDSAASNSTKSVLWSYIKGLFAQKVHTHTAEDLTTLVPVPGGGTGAADAAGARANLGAVGFSDLAAYDKTVKATYPVAAGQSITAGDVVDVVGGEVVGGVAAGTLSVGTVVQLNENGSLVDYVVVHQGKPSSLYDDSCNGTWILRKDIFEKRQWNSSDVNDWANSTLKAYLDSTFLARFDSATQAAIKQVKIPYRPGSGTSTTVNSGSSGLSCKIFLLSGYEMGWTSSDNPGSPVDGAKLSYFDSGTGATAKNKRIAYLSGSATNAWLRSPTTNGSTGAWFVLLAGDPGVNGCSSSLGVRPAFILPSDFAVKIQGFTTQAIALTTAAAGQNCEIIYSGVASLPGITVGQKITSGGVYGVGVLDGVLQVWSKDRPGKVVTGSYVGTGTYGSANPTTIELPSGLTACLVIVESQTGQVGIITPSGTSGILILYSSGIGGRLLTISNPADGVGWYNTESAEYQMNYSGRIYNYTVFLE